ncbi:MAG: DUF3108 domain-containing protein [Bacteroidota bacterium]
MIQTIFVPLIQTVAAAIVAAGMAASDSSASRGASPEASLYLSQSVPVVLQVGEELEYKVSYAFFNLGKIVVRVTDREERNGRVVYRAKAIIDSAPGLPFVNLHIRFTSEFDEDLFSYQWVAEDSTEDEIVMRRLSFDYERNRVLVEKGKKQPDGSFFIESIDTAAIKDKCQDGFSLFYFARTHVLQKKTMDVPTFIEKEQVNTFFDFTNTLEDEEIDSVDYPIEVVDFQGRADFVGVFGLTGGFQGRFSNDAARVPVVAWMNVILGSIKIKLQRWDRPDWVPPKFKD